MGTQDAMMHRVPEPEPDQGEWRLRTCLFGERAFCMHIWGALAEDPCKLPGPAIQGSPGRWKTGSWDRVVVPAHGETKPKAILMEGVSWVTALAECCPGPMRGER